MAPYPPVRRQDVGPMPLCPLYAAWMLTGYLALPSLVLISQRTAVGHREVDRHGR